jgi:linoleoyl-CoA desaturase
MTTTPPTFARQDKLKFFRTLNSRVNNYFKENNIKNRELETSFENHYPDHSFLAPYFLISPLICLLGSSIVDDSYGHRYGWCRYECYA